MIIDELVLHNFGVYKGRQTVALAPPSRAKPITLLGGLNGGGKTTFLDALQLALYGKRARCSNRGALAYDEFLRRSIHRGRVSAEGAAVEIAFRHWSEGREEHFRVHRSWADLGGSIRERVVIVRNDREDPVLTDAWGEYVEAFMPAGISHLFLFDGEKIEQLADEQASAQLLSNAVSSLLGLDLVEQLSADLAVLERKKRTEARAEVDQTEATAFEREIEQHTRRVAKIIEKQAPLRNELARLQKELKELLEKFQRQGGELLQQRGDLEKDAAQLEKKLHGEREQLRVIAEGIGPFLLVRDLVSDLASQDQEEQKRRQQSLITDALRARDDALLTALRAAKVDKPALKAVEKFLTEDVRSRQGPKGAAPFLSLSDATHSMLSSLVGGSLREVEKQAVLHRDRAASIERERQNANRRIEAIPDEDTLAQLVAQRRKIEGQLAKAEGKLSFLDEELAQTKAERTEAETKVQRLRAKENEGLFEQDADARILKHSARVRGTLGSFREALLKRNTERLEQLVIEGFTRLLRKEGFISRLTIDPQTFRVDVYDADSELLPPERLSAGERQLLAVALLWGLARASGRSLPAVIDTPLGRLDSLHRKHLVERYFPYASHQVLLLSTDEEIDRDHFASLEPFIGHTYVLEHDDKEHATAIRPGYFRFHK